MFKTCRFCLLLILLVSFLSSVPSSFGQRGGNTRPRYGGVFHLKSISNGFRMELDPASPESYVFVSEQIFDGLVKLDKNLNPTPHLAEYWVISQDGKKYTFYLKKGVKFHHGSELSAEDVKFSLERILDEKTGSPYYQFFLPRVVGAREFRAGKAADAAGFKVVDKYTFEIQWTEPFVSSLFILSMHFCKILPRQLVLNQGKRYFSKPSGTGPFVYDSWIRDTRLNVVGVRLERNDEYFGGKPYLDGVEFCPQFTLDHFLNGEIESIPVLSEGLLKSNYQVFEDGLLYTMFLGMSCNIPPFDSPAARKAILHAVNKEEVVRAGYDARYVRRMTNNFIPSRLPGFFPKDDEKSYDPEISKKILNEQGFSAGREFPALTLFVELPKTDAKFKIYRELRWQLDAVGLKLKLSYYGSLEEVKGFKEPYLVLFGRAMSCPGPEDIIRPLFHSKSVFNVFNYENPELERILAEAEVERSWTKRVNLFHQVEQILSSDVPAIPLFSQQNRVVMQPYVRGVEIPSLGLYYLDARKIWLDK